MNQWRKMNRNKIWLIITTLSNNNNNNSKLNIYLQVYNQQLSRMHKSSNNNKYLIKALKCLNITWQTMMKQL